MDYRIVSAQIKKAGGGAILNKHIGKVAEYLEGIGSVTNEVGAELLTRYLIELDRRDIEKANKLK